MATLPSDWNELIGLLNQHRVRYLVVGAHALAANGRPRATQDLDLFVDRSARNVDRLAGALLDFGFRDLAREAGKFLEPARMVSLGAPPLRIDIMNHIDGVSFREAWRGRVAAQFGDHEVGFLGLAELRKNKSAAGRPKDLADVAILDEMEQALRGAARAGSKSAKRPRRRS
jgi:hypothetical protein